MKLQIIAHNYEEWHPITPPMPWYMAVLIWWRLCLKLEYGKGDLKKNVRCVWFRRIRKNSDA